MNSPDSIHGAAPLSDWGVIRARGADAVSFLNGQLTSDIATLDATQARLAGYCSPKGRLLASFIAWKDGDDVLLACRAGVLPATLKRLAMFVLRAKCTLSDASGEVPLVGLVGSSAIDAGTLPPAAWLRTDHQGCALIRLPDGNGATRALLAGGPAGQLAAAAPALALDTWRWLEVSSGVASIELATVDQFVPQTINFELVGGVSFRKGCFPGQEVVARSQYRGTVKRRGFLFDCDATAGAGQELFHSDDPAQPAGMVVNAAPGLDGGSRVLAQVKLSALESGTLHLGSADGPVLRRIALPYPIPADADAAA